jgi:hypothetical protein
MRISRSLCVFVMLFIVGAVRAQQAVPVTGKVIDADTREPVPGALIHIRTPPLRVYSTAEGDFTLSLPPGSYSIRISSLGYRKLDTIITPGSSPITFALSATSIPLKNVQVTGTLDGNLIVRHAIQRKEENNAKVGSIEGLLYSKFNLQLQGDALGRIKESERSMILETFANTYYRGKQSRVNIIQRRQTSNIPPSDNILSLGNYFSFYKDSIRILNTEILSPLSTEAFSRYTYSIQGTTTLDDRKVYIIGIHPTTDVLPVFEGVMKILDGTFDIIEVDVHPSKATAIAFIRELRLQQKFEEIQPGLWYPTYWQATGKGGIDIIDGIVDVDGDFTASSVYTDLQLNTPIPDATFDVSSDITVASLVDSMRPEYWRDNTLSNLSPLEAGIYRAVDSTVAYENSTFRVVPTLNPGLYLDFNRAGGWSAGLSLEPKFGPLEMNMYGAYSFGLKEPLGEVEVNLYPFRDGSTFIRLTGSAFSRLASTTDDRSYSRLINTMTAALFNKDYYDYYRQHGWNAGGTIGLGKVQLKGRVEFSRDFSLPSIEQSFVVREIPRLNPLIVSGNYRAAHGAILFGDPSSIINTDFSGSPRFDAQLSALYGEEKGENIKFRAAEITGRVIIPTIATGYYPMHLRIGFQYGKGSKNLPLQFQFRLPTSSSVVARFGAFYSAPVATYGGTDIGALYADHNFTDIFWRWLGLPTFQGRGLELIVGAAVGATRNDNYYGYVRTARSIYAEMGLGIGKIPTFFSNILFFQLDARWGISSIARGNFGMALTLSSPF